MTDTNQDDTSDGLAKTNTQLRMINRVIRHDIRNDMATAAGWAEELRSHVDEDGQPILDRISDAIERTVDLTEASKKFVTAVVDGSEDIEPLSLRRVVTNEAERLHASVEQADVTCEEIPDVDVRANHLLRSVFGNVLDNAVNHADSDHPQIVVSADRDDESVTVRVADDGPGISPDRRDAVFGRSDEGLEHPASGLGLHLVDGLVSGYGGSVWIEGNEPSGTVVVIELPVATPDGPGDGVDAVQASDGPAYGEESVDD